MMPTNEDLRPAHEMLAQRVKELAQERDRLEQLVSEAHLGIREDVESMRRDLLGGLEACVDQRALKNLIERDIGEDGKTLERKITNIVERWGQTLTGQANPIFDQISASMEENDSLFGDLMKLTRDEFERQACPGLAEIRQIAKEQETNLLQVKKKLQAIAYVVLDFRNLRHHGWE